MEEVPLTITETDVVDPKLLLRFQRKVVDRLGGLSQRVSAVENAKTPLPLGPIKQGLEAGGSAPLNLDNLLGTTAQPQFARAPRLSSVPTDLILQQYRDEQLVLIQSTSTGYDLYTVVAGNPTTLSRLITGLSTGSSVGSTSTNLMTLDTVQTVTTAASKTVGASWRFNADQSVFAKIGVNTTAPAQALDLHTTSATNDIFVTMGVDAAAGPAFNFGYSGNSLGRSSAFMNVRPDGAAAAPNPSIRILTGNTERLRADGTGVVLSNGDLTMSGRVINYHGINTAAEGVPYLLSRYALTGISTAGALSTMYTTTAAGEYRISYYIAPITTGTMTGIVFQAQWTDEKETKTPRSSAAISTTSTTTTNTYDQGVWVFHSANGKVIQCQTAILGTSTVAPLGSYDVYALLERLS